jgi:mannonate dehydratase
MKLSLLLPPSYDERKWTLARQIGIKYVITKAMPELSGRPAPYNFEALKSIKMDFNKAGFELYGLEGDQFDMSAIKLGLNSRDELIDKYCKMIRNMGELGISLLCYNFMASIGWYRSSVELPERGGALTSGFDIDGAKNNLIPVHQRISEQKLWENLFYFLNAVLPVAEANGVKMALHPDDPPLSPFKGTARILTSVEAFEKILKKFPSPSNGITFCLATFHTMGEDLKSITEKWIRGNRIFFIHLRNLKGTKDAFRETFIDNGTIRIAEMLDHFCSSGFDGIIRSDHAPLMYGESQHKFTGGISAGYEILGHLFSTGYIKGICDSMGIKTE